MRICTSICGATLCLLFLSDLPLMAGDNGTGSLPPPSGQNSNSSGAMGMNADGGECETCNECCGRHGHHKRRNAEGLSPSANCGCNGSYKFPVPPLYTYHWPGMFSAQRMTDYHSPWRFPPIKAYQDEPPYQRTGHASLRHIQRPLCETERGTDGIETASSRLDRLAR